MICWLKLAVITFATIQLGLAAYYSYSTVFYIETDVYIFGRLVKGVRYAGFAGIILPLFIAQMLLSIKTTANFRRIWRIQLGILTVQAVIVVVCVIEISWNAFILAKSFGPLFMPENDGTMVHWYTRGMNPTELRVNDVLQRPKTTKHYSSVFVPLKNFTYTFEGVQTKYTTPSNVQKMMVTSDIHAVDKYVRLAGHDFDLHLIAGDVSQKGSAMDFSRMFRDFHRKPFVLNVGNHDGKGSAINHLVQKDRTFYQEVGDVGIYSLWVFNSGGVFTINHKLVDQGIKFIEDNINKKAKYKFIVVHQPMYSLGTFGSNPYLTRKLEQLLDAHKNVFRAVFTGHDHLFCAFKRNDVMIFVNACGGGGLDYRPMKDWKKRFGITKSEAHGPLKPDNSKRIGMQYHLDSWIIHSKTEVIFDDKKLKYNVYNLDTGDLVHSYVQDLS